MNIIKTSNNKEWLEARHKYLNASEVGCFYDPKAYKTELELYAAKKQNSIECNQEFNIQTESGKFLEPFIAKCYEISEGYESEVFEGYVVHPNNIMGATPDYIHPIADGKPIYTNGGAKITKDDGLGLIELKTANSFSFKDKYVDGEPSLCYIVQLQHQLACTGYKWGRIVTLVDNAKLDIATYKRDDAFLYMHERRCQKFWNDVKNNIEPEATNSKKDTEVLKQLYPADYEEKGDFSDNEKLLDLIIKWQECKTDKSIISKKYTKLGNDIRQIIKNYRISFCNQFQIKIGENEAIYIKETTI